MTSPETESESSDSDSDSDSDTHKAPNELIMEFLECVMNQDMENALKLCRMILIYEPDNTQALSFLPVLQEKKDLGEHCMWRNFYPMILKPNGDYAWPAYQLSSTHWEDKSEQLLVDKIPI